MFIKFGDKTKKIIVKNSKDDSKKDKVDDENSIFLDENESNDRRIKILNEYADSEKEEKKS